MNTTQFTATAHSTVADKIKFAEHFKKFMLRGCPDSLFFKWFYSRLSMCFGMIAHYDIHGFYNVYFLTTAGKVQFIKEVTAYPCFGDPAHTYSDVEQYLQEWVREQGLQAILAETLAKEQELAEMYQRDKLIAKHGLPEYEIKREQA